MSSQTLTIVIKVDLKKWWVIIIFLGENRVSNLDFFKNYLSIKNKIATFNTFWFCDYSQTDFLLFCDF